MAESAFITFTYPPGGAAFPLYLPRAFSVLRAKTVAGLFSAAMSAPLPILRPFAHGPSVPLIVLGVAIVLLALSVRRSSLVILPLSGVLALWISLEIGSHVGYLIAPRYQVPLFGALFFSLSFAASRPIRLWVCLLAAVELVLLPTAVSDVEAKANGKEIAAVIEKETPRARTAIIVQHALRLGYPDPLHNFVLEFYLDELHPEMPPIHIFELPLLRDITGFEGVGHYFGGGPELKRQYAAKPLDDWKSWLQTCPYDRLWYVFPLPAIGIEKAQTDAFAVSLAESGFVQDRTKSDLFEGYPATELWLLVRRPT